MNNPCKLIILFHKDDGLSSTLERIFENQKWIEFDLAENNDINMLRILIITQGRSHMNPLNICLRHGHYKSGKKYLDMICMNNRQYIFNAVIHCNEFIPRSVQACSMLNADYILLKKKSWRHGWPPNIFKTLNIPEDKVRESTCDLVGVRYNKSFIEWRDENELASCTRTRERCALIFEELVKVVWHPDRVKKMLDFNGMDFDDF
jgi:hypothetical protein